MLRATGIACHHAHPAPRTKHPQLTLSTHLRAARALGTTLLLVAATIGCTAQPAERSVVPSPTASPAALPLLEEQPQGEPVAAGQYVVGVDGAPFTHPLAPVLQVPPGFINIDGTGVRAEDDELGYRLVWLWDVKSVFTHPCDVSGSPEPVGPSVADLAGALAAQPMREATKPVPVTIGGYDGLYVELSTPDDISNCRAGYFRSWPGREDPAAGLTDLIWVIDVEGQRITFDLSYPPAATPEQVEELRRIVTTATFTPPEAG